MNEDINDDGTLLINDLNDTDSFQFNQSLNFVIDQKYS